MDEALRYLDATDTTGAKPLHALLISNSEAAIQMCVDLIRHSPIRALDSHATGHFTGENCIHVLAVQLREDELCELFDTIAESLSRAEVLRMLTTQVSSSLIPYGQCE